MLMSNCVYVTQSRLRKLLSVFVIQVVHGLPLERSETTRLQHYVALNANSRLTAIAWFISKSIFVKTPSHGYRFISNKRR